MRRILCALLAVLLLASMLPAATPAADAADNAGFRALSQYLQEKGEHTYLFFSTETYSLSMTRILWSNETASTVVFLNVYYVPQEDSIKIEAKLDFQLGVGDPVSYDVQFVLYRDGSFDNVYCDCLGGYARYKLSPASFTVAATLKAYEYRCDSTERDRMDQAASTLLKETLEGLQMILKQKGRSIADLGFKAYETGHSHKWDKGRVLTQPTCGAHGEKEYFCSVCKSLAVEFLDFVGEHRWESSTVSVQPSCTRAGELLKTCAKCGDRQGEPIPPLGHSWSFTECEDELPEEKPLHNSQGTYTCSRCGTIKSARLCASEVFTDMPAEGNWAHDPIDWAYFGGLTAGKTASTFAPKSAVTRAEVMTFLWKVMGSPEPEPTASPFTDVPEGKYFFKPVLWALEHQITAGKTAESFGARDKCSRAQIMTFLWPAAGKPEPSLEESPFTDVPEGKYYYKPVLWAVEHHITGGTTATTFSPNASCTRAQVMAFLYQAASSITELPVGADEAASGGHRPAVSPSP